MHANEKKIKKLLKGGTQIGAKNSKKIQKNKKLLKGGTQVQKIQKKIKKLLKGGTQIGAKNTKKNKKTHKRGQKIGKNTKKK